jgi:hypothetical protein
MVRLLDLSIALNARRRICLLRFPCSSRNAPWTEQSVGDDTEEASRQNGKNHRAQSQNLRLAFLIYMIKIDPNGTSCTYVLKLSTTTSHERDGPCVAVI